MTPGDLVRNWTPWTYDRLIIVGKVVGVIVLLTIAYEIHQQLIAELLH